MVEQFCEYPKNHWSVYLVWVNRKLCELYLENMVRKRNWNLFLQMAVLFFPRLVNNWVATHLCLVLDDTSRWGHWFFSLVRISRQFGMWCMYTCMDINSFVEVQLIFNMLHMFKVYSLIIFDMYIYICETLTNIKIINIFIVLKCVPW